MIYSPDCSSPKNYDDANYCVQKSVSLAAVEALNWSRWQTLISGIGLIGVVISLGFSAWASRAAGTAAIAALESNKLNQIGTVNDQRPWIVVEPSITERVIIGDDDLSGEIGIRVENIGKSPALYIHTNMKSRIFALENADKVFKDFCAENKKIDRSHYRNLLPGQSYVRPWKTFVDENDVRDGYRCAGVMICVSYESSLTSEIYQTAALFIVENEEGEDGISRQILLPFAPSLVS